MRCSLTTPGAPGAWSLTRLVDVRTVHSGEYWNCIVAVKLSGLYHVACDQDGILLMESL